MRIGIDLGGSHIGVGLVSEDGVIIAKKETDLQEKQNIEEKIETIIVSHIQNLLQENQVSMDRIQSIGIAAPGTVSNGIIVTATNLGLQQYPIVEKLRVYFPVPIFLKNDAKCAGICENLYGSLKKYENSIFLTIGTGIGGAIFWNKQLLVPKQYPGFELGHMIIQKDGKPCSCGKQGCFETYASIVALKKQVIEAYKKQESMTGKELLEFIQKHSKDNNMQMILQEYSNNLSIGISNLIDIFEPEVVSIGGSFIYYQDIFLERLQKKLVEGNLLFNKQRPKIILATMKNDAGMIGASRIEE